jgi:fermentation-respiration switch protein FrsA (DUF1100 family)
MNSKFSMRKLLIGDFSLKRFSCSTILIYGCLALYAYFGAERIIFQPQKASYSDSQEILKLKTQDGIHISALYLPNAKATYTILYSHGNAEDLGDLKPMLEDLNALGFSVFSYDYHGYGTSRGEPSEKNAYQDINAAYAYLTEHLKIPPNRIILYGRSVGGGPTVDLASRQKVAGLVLESSFVTAFRVLTRIPIVPFDQFSNNRKLLKVYCPTLIMHGKKDRVIPFHHGEKLFAMANEPKRCLWVDKANHDNLPWIAGDLYAKTLRQFTESIDQLQKPTSLQTSGK